MSRSSLRRLRLLIAFALWIVPTAASADSVTLAWDPSAGATGYTVRWGTTQGSYPNAADAGNTTTFSITGLTAGATYWTVVEAYNGDSVSGYSTALQFTVPVAVACTYSISPATVSVPNTATSGSITVTTQTGCAWSATSASAFLTFQDGVGRTGSGTVTYSIAANIGTTSRTAIATVAGNTFTASQAAAPACTYSINPTTISVSYLAASGTVSVTTQTNCAWSAVSSSTFLTFQNGTGRSGPGSVTFSMTANTGTISRTATATVAGQAFTVPQAAPPQACTYSISPLSVNAPAAGMSGTITVTTQSGCAWSASSASTFLTFTDGTGRTGSGTVTYVAASNPSAFRTGTATVAGKSFTLWQTGTSCTYSVTPASVSTAAAAYSGTVTVTTQAGCGWSATSFTAFLTFTNGTGRSGPGTVSFTATENTGTIARNAAALVAGTSFSLAQAGTTQPALPAQWSSDFDGDGSNDILVQDSAVGTVEAWFLSNATVKGTQALSDTLDANRTLVGRGDFNADGKPDLVWQQKTDGQVSLWYMNGTTKTGVVTLSNGQLWSAQWKVVGVGDFNADGYPDLAWQHSGDGSLSVWLMNGSTVTATTSPTPDRITDLLWKVVGVGDFNADGKSDLLWRHYGTGEVGTWLMNGLSRIIYSPLSPFSVPDQRWQVGAVTDANGDGKPDLVWQHTDGSIMIWHMNGTSRVSYPIVPTLVPVGWFIVGPK